MPKVNVDYSKIIMYKIVCNDLAITDCYVGHTTGFTKRKCHHKNSSLNSNYVHHNLKIYKTIRDNGGWDNFQMIEIEKYPCNDGNEARARERYWFEQFNATMNSNSPYQRRIDDSTRAKQWRDNNLDHTCECGMPCTRSNINRHRKTERHTQRLNEISPKQNN